MIYFYSRAILFTEWNFFSFSPLSCSVSLMLFFVIRGIIREKIVTCFYFRLEFKKNIFDRISSIFLYCYIRGE